MVPGLRRNDLLLEACQHLLPVGHGQTQIGDIVKIIRPVDRHDVGKQLFTVSLDFHQPHNPSHASTPGQTTDVKIPLWPSHPQTCDGPRVDMANLLVGSRQHAANVPCQWQQCANRDQRQHDPPRQWPLQIGHCAAHQPPPSIRQGDGNVSRASAALERQQLELLTKQRVMRIGNDNAGYYSFEFSGSSQCSVMPR